MATDQGTPSLIDGTDRKGKSTKIPDPPQLSDGKDPTFEAWRVQVNGKFRVNADHFDSEEAKMYYVLNRTTGDAQVHLLPRYEDEAEDPFESAKEMIAYLATIFEDPFKVQNARYDYRKWQMKPAHTFSDFYTKFLHVAGQARIPLEDYQPDLFEKLTLELQRAVLPSFQTFTNHRELANHCLQMDQGLRRIRTRADQIQARKERTTGASATVSLRTPSAIPVATASRASTPSTNTGLERPRPVYSNPERQAASNRGACFTCGSTDHFARNCPQNRNKGPEIKAIEETGSDSGKEDP
jgi:hypothetical protein